MRDVYKNINYYNPDKKNKILIVFDDMIADMIYNKKLDSIVTELFIRARFTYSPLRKAFEKQIKTIEDQGEKQIKAI